MAIRLFPQHSDPESDLETQIAVMGALIAGNLLSIAVLQGRLQKQRAPETPLPQALAVFPKLSIGLFLGAAVYFLALSRRDVAEQPASGPLREVFWANLLSTAAVAFKTHVVFQSRPESAASVGAVEF